MSADEKCEYIFKRGYKMGERCNAPCTINHYRNEYNKYCNHCMKKKSVKSTLNNYTSINVYNEDGSLFEKFSLSNNSNMFDVYLKVSHKLECQPQNIYITDMEDNKINHLFDNVKWKYEQSYLDAKKFEKEFPQIQEKSDVDVRQIIFDSINSTNKDINIDVLFKSIKNLDECNNLYKEYEELKKEFIINCVQKFLPYLEDDEVLNFVTNLQNFQEINQNIKLHPDNKLNQIKKERMTNNMFKDD